MPELPYSADCVGYREEYALVHVESAEGAFVGEIRRACEKVLVDVSKQCFDTEVLNSKNGRKDSGERGDFVWQNRMFVQLRIIFGKHMDKGSAGKRRYENPNGCTNHGRCH